MGTKNAPGKFDCYSAADPDEPMFVLLGRDPSAGALVRLWALMRSGEESETAKCSEAFRCADALDAWAKSRGKVPRGYVALEPHQSPIRSGMSVRLKDFPGPRMGVRRVKSMAPPRQNELLADVFYFAEDGVMHETAFRIEWLLPWEDTRQTWCTCDAQFSPSGMDLPTLHAEPASHDLGCPMAPRDRS